MMRLATIVLWAAFPLLWLLIELDVVSHPTDETLWCLFDFLGKAIFSTSLLHGNYATMEQRRLVAMTGKRPFHEFLTVFSPKPSSEFLIKHKNDI